MEVSEKRKEIQSAISTQDKELLNNIKSELDLMEISDGLENKNNLDQFYSIWKSFEGNKGNKNDINSWTAYALGMTSAKPDGDFLPERRAFARAGFPDVDADFDDERRGEVYEYLIDKWGRENVGNIGTYISLKMKAAIRNVAKAVDAAQAFYKGPEANRTENFQLANEISNTLPVLPTGVIKVRGSDGEDVIIKKAREAYKHIPDFRAYMDKYPDILKHCDNVEGLVGSFGKHAAGIVISDVPLRTIAPLRRASRGPGLATQYTMEDLESIGLIKFDILAIAALTTIRDATERVKKAYGIDIDIENLPLDDRKTLNLYRSGHLNGVFQCESYGMQHTMREIGVDRFDDVMAAIALYRPGPMDSIDEYVARKKGEKKVDYWHNAIEPHVKRYLEKTYGILVYQEQVMQIANSLAGLTITDGYILIKAVGKKKIHLMEKFEKQFVAGGVAKGVPEEVMSQYWKKFIVPFANYGFNAAHSCCYAYLSYQTAYLKANYPDEFAVAFLNTFTKRAMFKSANDWKQVEMMEKDAQRTLGIKFLSRNLNECNEMYEVIRRKDTSAGIPSTEIRPGVCCKGVGWESAKEIVANQPYKGLEDLASKTSTSIVTSEVIGALVDSGFFFKGRVTQKKRDEIVEQFVKIRKGLKASAARGLVSQDMFA